MHITGSRAVDSNPGKFVDSTAFAATATYYFAIDTVDMLSIHLHVAAGGSLDATVTVSVSNSYKPGSDNTAANAIVPFNGVDITAQCLGITAITGASAQDQMIVIQRTGSASRINATWAAVTITRNSGTGTLQGWYHGKLT
jgi:hypothetical protein